MTNKGEHLVRTAGGYFSLSRMIKRGGSERESRRPTEGDITGGSDKLE